MPRSDPARLCVSCRRHPVDPAWRPFCSKRCQLQDLSRWADGSYKLTGEPVGKDDENEESRD